VLRSLFLAALVVVMAACRPDLPQSPPTSSVTAVFDPTTARVPLPNDLALAPFSAPNSACPGQVTGPALACAQAELLASFNGGFPSDQTLGITIEFTQTNFDADGNEVHVAPDLDLATFTPETFFIFGSNGAVQGEVPTEPLTAASYVKSADHGTLTIHHQGRAPWQPGAYAVLLRGGPNGIKTTDGTPVHASQVFHLIAQGLDMTDPANLGLLRAQTGSLDAAITQGSQLNLLIAVYKAMAFPVADTRFPHQELAILTTFRIGPTVTNVTIDPARGLVPLPIDLLRDATTNRLTALAACTLAGSSLSADGTCPNPAAAGFQALDGFSTTGAILAPTSELVQAATVTPASLLLYDLSDPANPVQVPPASLIIEPCEFTSGCNSPTALSPVIAIQPAGATAGDPTSVFRSRPLKDNTNYAVVMTTDIKDKAGNAIGPGTVAKVVRFVNPITVAGKSGLRGIDDGTAAALEKMRLQLKPVFATLAAAGKDASKIAMAYTFKTQTILSQAVQLAALPYTTPDGTALPIAATFAARQPADAFARYGADANVIPLSNIAEILEVDIPTFNALDPVTGAFLADPTRAVVEPIHVLIATPLQSNTSIPACTGPLAGFGKCAPMMVFRHGLGGGRANMLAIADRNAAAGMVTVAIDAAKHGDRSFCTSGTSGAASGCNNGAMCTTTLPPGAQGDAAPPGTCGADGFDRRPVSPTCTGACATAAVAGIPRVSSNYLITANFFRTRDTFRQDLIDESQLIRALAFSPTGAPPTGHVVFDRMAGQGVIIDPAAIYFSGQSLGAIQGLVDVAANPRISKAVFTVGGGTVVDIFSNSPAFSAQFDQLLAGLGVQRGTSQFLQLLVVAKTVLDPADPVNFAGHLSCPTATCTNTLPNLLPPLGGNPNGTVLQLPKKILTQVANCDAVVPNPFSFVYASNVPTGPLPTGAAFFAPGEGTFQLFVGAGFNPANFGSCASGAAPHGFLTDWTIPSLTTNAQTDLADFVMSDTLPPRVQTP
jgi:hypothetical protein